MVHAHPTLQAKSSDSARVLCLVCMIDARSDVGRPKQLDMAWVAGGRPSRGGCGNGKLERL